MDLDPKNVLIRSDTDIVEARQAARVMAAQIGFTGSDGRHLFSADWNVVEPGYFSTLKMAIVSGRDFTAADRATSGTPKRRSLPIAKRSRASEPTSRCVSLTAATNGLIRSVTRRRDSCAA